MATRRKRVSAQDMLAMARKAVDEVIGADNRDATAAQVLELCQGRALAQAVLELASGATDDVTAAFVRAGLRNDSNANAADPSRGWTLVLLSLATSIDALAVGFSLSMVNQAIWLPAMIIGLVTVVMSVVGLYLGQRLSSVFGSRVEILGGLILIFIGAKILGEHLFIQ